MQVLDGGESHQGTGPHSPRTAQTPTHTRWRESIPPEGEQDNRRAAGQFGTPLPQCQMHGGLKTRSAESLHSQTLNAAILGGAPQRTSDKGQPSTRPQY